MPVVAGSRLLGRVVHASLRLLPRPAGLTARIEIGMLQLLGPVAQAASPAQQQAGGSKGGASGACSGLFRRTCIQQPISQQHQPPRRLAAPARWQRLTPSAARKEAGGAGLNRLESPVPREQRPVNELQQLKDTPLLSWVRAPGGSSKPLVQAAKARAVQCQPAGAPGAWLRSLLMPSTLA